MQKTAKCPTSSRLQEMKKGSRDVEETKSAAESLVLSNEEVVTHLSGGDMPSPRAATPRKTRRKREVRAHSPLEELAITPVIAASAKQKKEKTVKKVSLRDRVRAARRFGVTFLHATAAAFAIFIFLGAFIAKILSIF